MYTMITAGVDGTRRGWVYSIVEGDRVLEIGFMEHFMFLDFPTLVDIPIGLPKKARESATDSPEGSFQRELQVSLRSRAEWPFIEKATRMH